MMYSMVCVYIYRKDQRVGDRCLSRIRYIKRSCASAGDLGGAHRWGLSSYIMYKHSGCVYVWCVMGIITMPAMSEFAYR